jgi:formylglycine-generating enzyme required for sulfatase activity
MGGGFGLFYYSGHGMQVKGENYLIPIDANVVREDDLKRKTISARDILDKMDEAKTHLNLVFLDACRNNPFPRSVRAVSRGLASMNAPTGTLLVFATNPDNVADDGTGRNGIYTKHLLQYITQPGLEVGMLLRRVRTAVRKETGGQQVPWENGSMEGEFYFNGTGGTPPVPPSIVQPQPTPLTPTPQVTETSPGPTPPSPSGGTQVAVGVALQPSEATKPLRNSIGMEFVLIPAGEFQMGSNEGGAAERPAHRVRISAPFYLGKYEVTQAQWEAVMGTNPSHFTGNPNRPVANVSWEEVQEFIKRLNQHEGWEVCRLPTEAQWEYAARAGTTTEWYGDVGAIAWSRENSGGKTHEVGQKRPNAWGLYDMLGNVGEWCHDGPRTYTAEAVVDPMGPTDASPFRVSRGGGFGRSAQYARAATRVELDPSDRFDSLGFRCASSGPSK